ncbi:hypothetical protein COX18_05940 [Candidatus Desantisbacteria bacterium CG23_combo_of_CG06-09_8_20_14_all_40_23]|uniref:PKD domain-containing protein n=1 Tax=Candidatus Desantisbacteria bacterium CG23_combo_of_CG06-09_8_20_14_all_40_23 TaxID=1974550 RepID=A0A2H0A775_9BACT|nr:MAG: hypothetical protein COX18_05940 [Candidatus Desantisbacteria bacterium CG23_combo_of_CG06-09_8_20_14_all_40_23]
MMKKYQGWEKIGFKQMLVGLAVGMILMVGGNWAWATETVTTDNLLKNPGAKDGMNDWINNNPSGTFTARYSGYSGVCFDCNTAKTENNYMYMYQDVDVSKYATDIDRGDVTVNFEGYFRSGDDRDYGQYQICFIDQAGNTIANENAATGWDNNTNSTWEKKTIGKILPVKTRKIRIYVEAKTTSTSSYCEVYFDEMSLTITYPKPPESKLEIIEPADKRFAFGDMYSVRNGSTKKYNKALKKTLKFKNAGDPGMTLDWKITASSDEIKFSTEELSGELSTGQSKSIDVWVENLGGGGIFTGHIDFNGGPTIWVSAPVHKTSEVSLVAPAKMSNNRVNVGINGSVNFKIKRSACPFYSGAVGAGYGWKKSDELTTQEILELTAADFNATTDPEKSYMFSDIGNQIVYAASFETVDNKKVVGELLRIDVYVWEIPSVNDTPGTTSSWYSNYNKYVGIKGQPVYLQATGRTNSPNLSGSIAKFIWDFDNDWDTIEKEQTAGEQVSHTWNTANLNGRIRCRAVTNYGIQSEDQIFDLKIYEPVKVGAQGPYTGRPEKPVKLKCSFNNMSYPGATYQYEWSVNNGSRVSINDNGDEVEYKWSKNGTYQITAKVIVTTEEGLVISGQSFSHVTIEAGKPTAMPGGPYKGGIFGGNFSPIQFEGNHPNFVEDKDIGHIDTWKWSFEGKPGTAPVFLDKRRFICRLLQKSPFMGYFFGQCLFHITRCLLGCYGFNG